MFAFIMGYFSDSIGNENRVDYDVVLPYILYEIPDYFAVGKAKLDRGLHMHFNNGVVTENIAPKYIKF